MEYTVIEELSDQQIKFLDNLLEKYDKQHMDVCLEDSIHIGIMYDNKLIAGINAYCTAFRILYIATLYVDEKFRGKGLASKLITILEDKAKKLGASIIRVDTFGFQGSDFYKKMGYQQIGCYKDDIDNFSEYFFIKKILEKEN